MSRRSYWVTLEYAGRRLGAGFFVNSRYILTAAHCLRDVPLENAVVRVKVGQLTSERANIVERNSKVDLALLEFEPRDFDIDIPVGDHCARDDRWESPYRPTRSDPVLAGTVSRSDCDYECVSGNVISALQLLSETELGDYSGYSGAPIERHAAGQDPTLAGILLEQFPDRADPDRASNVLFAGTIGNALKNFPQFDVGHLVKVLSTDEADTETARTHPPRITRGDAVSKADELLSFLERCADREYLEADELRMLRLKVIERVIDTEMT